MQKTFLSILSCICVLICSYTTDLQAQSIHFSQLYNQPLLINPAVTGIQSDTYRAGIAYRNQWQSIPAPYSTIIASFDMPILACKMKNGHFGVGAMVYRNASGDGILKERAAALSFAYHHSLNKNWVISLGSQVGYTHKKLNITKLNFPFQISNYQINPVVPNSVWLPKDHFSYFNSKFGLSSSLSVSDRINIQFGTSYDYTFSPSQAFLTSEAERNELDGVWVTYLHYKYKIGNRLSLNAFLFDMKQTFNSLGIIGASFGYHFNGNSVASNAVHIGAGYRTNDALIFLLGSEIGNFGVTASYDLNISDLKSATDNQGAIEVSLVYRGLTKNCN